MIQLHSLALGRFPGVEPLNPRFIPGHAKLRIIVDTEAHARVADHRLLERLVEAFPGIARHECRAHQRVANRPAAGTAILLLEDDSSANQAHLLEHLTLEILSALGQGPRLSGVTCAYVSPPERNDVFVECSAPESGRFAVMLAIAALNTALMDESLSPLYPDIARCARILRERTSGPTPATRLAALAGIDARRAAGALEFLAHARLVEAEPYAMNFSGDPHYRFVGVGAAG